METCEVDGTGGTWNVRTIDVMNGVVDEAPIGGGPIGGAPIGAGPTAVEQQIGESAVIARRTGVTQSGWRGGSTGRRTIVESSAR